MSELGIVRKRGSGFLGNPKSLGSHCAIDVQVQKAAIIVMPLGVMSVSLAGRLHLFWELCLRMRRRDPHQLISTSFFSLFHSRIGQLGSISWISSQQVL
jgi:hypothetical protein